MTSEIGRGVVLNIDVDFGLGADGESPTELARNADAFGKLAATRIDYRQDNQSDVVGERDPTQPRPSPGKRKQNEAQGD